MRFIYLAVLLVSLGGMVLLDWRYRLFFWRHARRAALVLGAGLVFFLAWDVLGITLGIFARGGSAFMTGWMLLPQLPVEELFFLTFLCYLTMILVCGGGRLVTRARRQTPQPTRREVRR